MTYKKNIKKRIRQYRNFIEKVIQKWCKNEEKTFKKSMRKKYWFLVGRSGSGGEPGRVTSEETNPQRLTRLGRLKARSGYIGPSGALGLVLRRLWKSGSGLLHAPVVGLFGFLKANYMTLGQICLLIAHFIYQVNIFLRRCQNEQIVLISSKK